MKKGLLLISILFLIGGGFAMAYAIERYSSASASQQLADKEMSEIKGTQDMARIEQLSTYMQQDLLQAGKALRMAEIGAGAGIIMLLAGVICFFKSRKKQAVQKA